MHVYVSGSAARRPPLISLGGLNKVVSLQFTSITGSVLALSKAWPRVQLASNISCHYALRKNIYNVGTVDGSNIGRFYNNLAVLISTAKLPNLIPHQFSGYMVCHVFHMQEYTHSVYV